jgi:hypothetical protein
VSDNLVAPVRKRRLSKEVVASIRPSDKTSAAMPLSFNQLQKNYGFDGETVKPPYQMVPLNEFKKVRVLGIPAAKVPTVTVDDTNVVEATYQGGYISLQGRGIGTTYVRASFAGMESVALEVTVKEPYPLDVAFYLVSDGKGQPARKKDPDVKSLLATLNNLHSPQNNVVFKLAVGLKPITVSGIDLSKGFVFDEVGSEEDRKKIVAKADSSEHYNIFFVGKVVEKKDAENGTNTIGATRNKKSPADVRGTIFEDTGSGLALAHEAGHYLMCSHDINEGYLMYEEERQGFTKINKFDINTMNGSGNKLR